MNSIITEQENSSVEQSVSTALVFTKNQLRFIALDNQPLIAGGLMIFLYDTQEEIVKYVKL
jgi:hypothetical protein